VIQKDPFPKNVCSFCKIVISQKQFAAEIITETDEVFAALISDLMFWIITTLAFTQRILKSQDI
jgi:hypothetical protein